jgi:RsiW-degrading membrane proteinase PrsW (M82 family)
MALTITCEGCRRLIQAKGPVSNNTIKCTRCGHLQWVPDTRANDVATNARLLAEAGRLSPAVAGLQLAGATSQELSRLFGADVATAASADALPVTPSAEAQEVTTAASSPTVAERSPAHYLYWLLLLTLIPLGLSVLQPKSDVKERFEQTERQNPELFRRWENSEDPTLDDLLGSLPGERIKGAYLPRGTWWHWAYALAAAVGFFVLSLLIFPQRINRTNLVMIGIFTGTAGVILLLIVQFLAAFTQGLWIRGGGAITVVFYILKFIGFSYRSAMDPDSDFVLSLVGFTFGVGLCEELCKALPLIWYYRGAPALTWRGACRWGLASGVGFGVAEGIMYSSDFYNGVHSEGIYWVRFISCVALHGIWCASVGITLYQCQGLFQGNLQWHEYALPLLRILAVAMLLHGLYDTVLKKELNELALAVAGVSFGWLAWQIESRREEDSVAPSVGAE